MNLEATSIPGNLRSRNIFYVIEFLDSAAAALGCCLQMFGHRKEWS